MMIDQLTYIADVKVGKVKGNSRVYPQLRLPSQYAKLTGKIASIYEMSEREGDIAFVIRFDSSETKGLAAYHERAERAEANFVRAEPCRGSDSGSNPDSGACFLLSSAAVLPSCKIMSLRSLISDSRAEMRKSVSLLSKVVQ
ncbi:MAG: hypothetical protein ACXV49_07525 [Halobacteriota archaeon]